MPLARDGLVKQSTVARNPDGRVTHSILLFEPKVCTLWVDGVVKSEEAHTTEPDVMPRCEGAELGMIRHRPDADCLIERHSYGKPSDDKVDTAIAVAFHLVPRGEEQSARHLSQLLHA